MRTVIMKSISAGPEGTLHPGVKYPLDDVEAKVLVDGGYADYETAMVQPAKKSVPDVEQIKKVKAEAEVIKAAKIPQPPKQPTWGSE